MKFVEERAKAEDAGVAWSLTSRADVFYDDGWYPVEAEKKGDIHSQEMWRWMGKTSIARIRGTGRAMKLSITGWVPMHLFGAPPFLTLRWNGRRLETFLAPPGHFTHTVTIPAELQTDGVYADFMIETSTVGHDGDDLRDLGYALAALDWAPDEDAGAP